MKDSKGLEMLCYIPPEKSPYYKENVLAQRDMNDHYSTEKRLNYGKVFVCSLDRKAFNNYVVTDLL